MNSGIPGQIRIGAKNCRQDGQNQLSNGSAKGARESIHAKERFDDFLQKKQLRKHFNVESFLPNATCHLMIRSALLAPNATPLTPSKDKGINETWKGRFLLLDGSSVEGYAKFIEGPQLINELLANMLARLVGLNVPEPFLVRVDKIDFPNEFARLGYVQDTMQAFGTGTLPGGSLAREWYQSGPGLINRLLDGTDEWKKIVAFDTWVGNVDRHLFNLFYDGSKKGQLWLLDHGHCFGSLNWTEDELNGTRNLTNRLLEELHRMGLLTNMHRKAVIDDAPTMQELSALVDLDGVIDDSYVRAMIPASTAQKLVQYLHFRSQHLIKLVADKVGMPVLELGTS